MGNEPLIRVVRSLPHLTPLKPVTPRIEYTEPTIVTPIVTNLESHESYFSGLQEAVDRLLKGYSLPKNTRKRGVLYGIREFHPDNHSYYADELEGEISKEIEFLEQAHENEYDAAATLCEQNI